MSYANFKGTLKKVNIKPKEEKEIVIKISGGELDGQLEALAGMVDLKVNVELDAAVMTYKREINVVTNMPTTQYVVKQSGIVEVKPPEQLELEGMPEEQIQTKEEDVLINREIIDEFVLSGLSPDYDDYHKDLIDILKRRIAGESYNKLAEEYELSTKELVEQIKMYRMHVAPLAEAWNAWRLETEEK